MFFTHKQIEKHLKDACHRVSQVCVPHTYLGTIPEKLNLREGTMTQIEWSKKPTRKQWNFQKLFVKENVDL